MTPELKAALEQQVANPRHCHLLMDGRIFKHAKPALADDPLAHLTGQPVRFTRLAAENMVRWATERGATAEIVAIGEPQPPGK